MIFLYISITIKEEDTDFSFFKSFLFMNALQYMDAYDYRMNLGKLKKEVNNIILIYGLCDMVNRAMTLVKYFTPNFGTDIMMCFIAASAGTEKWRTWKLCLNWG